MRRSVSLLLAAISIGAAAPPAGATHEPLAPQTQQAVTVALHAIVEAGLYDPLGDYYSYEAVTETDEGWVVSFVASLCYRNEEVETCDPHQGRSDHQSPDAWLDVVQQGDVLRVTAARGRFEDDDRAEIVGYQEHAAPQPATLSFPTARLDPPARDGEMWAVRAPELWSGVIPHDDRIWEVCVVDLVDSAGTVTRTLPYRLAVGTRGEDFRAGGFHGMEVDDDHGAVDVRITCEPFSGETWRGVAEPEITSSHGRAFVSVRMRWLPGYVAPGLDSRCDVTLRDRDGDIVKEVERRGPPGPWLTRRRFRRSYHVAIWVHRPKEVKSADVFCHEA